MLSRDAIVTALSDPEVGLAVTPLLNSAQIGTAGVDVRLGTDIVITRRATGAIAFDPAQVDLLPRRIEEYQQYVRRPFGSPIYLQPHEFALARTLEFVRLPAHIGAEAMGRSSWGRLGLIIATATMIQPGFSGTITLELANLGNAPIVLYVGMRIAQLVFTKLETDPYAPVARAAPARGRRASPRSRGASGG